MLRLWSRRGEALPSHCQPNRPHIGKAPFTALRRLSGRLSQPVPCRSMPVPMPVAVPAEERPLELAHGEALCLDSDGELRVLPSPSQRTTTANGDESGRPATSTPSGMPRTCEQECAARVEWLGERFWLVESASAADTLASRSAPLLRSRSRCGRRGSNRAARQLDVDEALDETLRSSRALEGALAVRVPSRGGAGAPLPIGATFAINANVYRLLRPSLRSRRNAECWSRLAVRTCAIASGGMSTAYVLPPWRACHRRALGRSARGNVLAIRDLKVKKHHARLLLACRCFRRLGRTVSALDHTLSTPRPVRPGARPPDASKYELRASLLRRRYFSRHLHPPHTCLPPPPVQSPGA